MELIDLKGGLVLPTEALTLALSLEARGFLMEPAPDGRLHVRPPQNPAGGILAVLSAEDRAAIHKWKPHLLAILAYEIRE